MSDLSRHRPYLLWGLAVVGVALAVALLLVPASSWIALDQRRSSLRTTPDGLAAWSASLEELGIPTAARYGSFTGAPLRERALVLMEPMLAPTPEEVHRIMGWIRGGGVLVHSPSLDSGLMDSVGVRLRVWNGDEADEMEAPEGAGIREGPESRVAPGGGRAPELRSGGGGAPGSFADHPWTSGLQGERDATTWVLEPEAGSVEGWIPLTRFPGPVGTRSSLAWTPVGEGGVLMLSEAEDLANGSLDDSPVALATTRAITDLLAPGDTLVFSEYHQGMDDRRGLLRESLAMARASGAGRVLLHVVIVGVLALVLVHRGLGAPIPSDREDRRSPREHVDALADILRSAEARKSVADRLVRGAARRMHLDTDGGATPGAQRSLRGAPRSGARPVGAGADATRILEQWARDAAGPGPARAALRAMHRRPVDLVALARALDALVERHEATRTS